MKAGAVMLGAALASGCTGGGGKPQRPVTDVSVPDVVPAPPVVNPMRLPLPLDAYMPTDEELKQVNRAIDLLTDQCMRRFGFSYTAPPPLPRVGPESNTDLRYGIHDLAVAQEFGYHPVGNLAARQQAEEAGVAASAELTPIERLLLVGPAIAGSEAPPPQLVGSIPAPPRGCINEARDQLTGGGPEFDATARKLNVESFSKATEHPQVQAAFAAWSACMKKRGYKYSDPVEIMKSPPFSADSGVTAVEIGTAVADVECRREANVIGAWYATEVAFQQAMIESNASTLDAAKARKDEMMRRASQALAPQ